MKKIGIFCGYYLPHLGGVERYVDKLSSALKQLGYQIVIVTSNHDNLEDYESIKGTKVYRLPIYSIAKDRYPIVRHNEKYKQLMERIKDEDIDYFIVNTRFHLTSLEGARMGKKLKKPVILIEHGTGHFTVNNKLLDFFGSIYEHLLSIYLKRFVNSYYGVSKKCNEWLRHFSIKSDGVFYNAISSDDSNNVRPYEKINYASQDIVVTYAGRLIKEKGILNLIDAFLSVKKTTNNKRLKLAIAGDGELYERIREHHEDSSITLFGRLNFEQILALYDRTDIFVYPSLYPEGLPTSILEAGLMECAIIATPKGGTEEVITSGQNGIIVDGSVKSLTLALETLTNDDGLRKSMGAGAKTKVVDRFDWKIVASDVDRTLKGFNTH